MTKYFVAGIDMTLIECGECGIAFAVPTSFNDKNLRLKTMGGWYCPNGHNRHYVGKTNEQKLKERLDLEIQCCISAREEANHFEKKAYGYKGYATRLKKKLGQA